MSNIETKSLIGTFEYVRNISKFYISKIDKDKVHERLSLNGTKFNSAYWLVTHLIWTERFLIIQGIGGKEMEDHWLDEYGFGSKPDEVKTKPDFDDVLNLFDEVHSRAIEVLNSTDDVQLDEPNHINASFGGVSDKRAVLRHAIRHEPMHIGQLSWILKIQNPDKTP